MKPYLFPRMAFSFLFAIAIYAADDYKLMYICNVTHQNDFSIDIAPGMTVRQLKELIDQHEEVPVDQQRLYTYDFVEGCCLPKKVAIELQDDQLCSSYYFRRYQVVSLHGDNTKKLHVMDMLRKQGFYIKVLDDTTIYELKQKIQKHKNVSADIQLLQIGERVSGGLYPKYRSVTLEDDQPISFYKLRRYQVVQLRRVSSPVKDVHKIGSE